MKGNCSLDSDLAIDVDVDQCCSQGCDLETGLDLRVDSTGGGMCYRLLSDHMSVVLIPHA